MHASSVFFYLFVFVYVYWPRIKVQEVSKVQEARRGTSER